MNFKIKNVTYAKIKHQQGSKNSQFNTRWCTNLKDFSQYKIKNDYILSNNEKLGRWTKKSYIKYVVDLFKKFLNNIGIKWYTKLELI